MIVTENAQPEKSYRNGQSRPDEVRKNTIASSPRMRLANVTAKREQGPPRVFLYGQEGIGKTSFASMAPAPIFIAPENGYPSGVQVSAFPEPQHWNEVKEAVQELLTQKHEYKTIVIDTLDWLVRFLYTHICAQHGKPNMEAFDFGKGYDLALTEASQFVHLLEKVRIEKKMMILILAHAELQKYENPTGPDYDRWAPKIHKKISALFREWSDAVLFASYDVMIKTKRREGDERVLLEKGKIKTSGSRVIFTNPYPNHFAKNRYQLPDRLPMEFHEFYKRIFKDNEDRKTQAEKLRKDIMATLKLLDDPTEDRENCLRWFEKIGDDVGKLQIGYNKLKTRLSEKLEEEENVQVQLQEDLDHGVRS